MIDPRNPNFADTPASTHRRLLGYQPADLAALPLVSVVTPFFNVGEVFHETAACVLGQSLQRWEWLIVNDGSTDASSLAILDRYRHLDPRIRVIDHPENRGLPSARNTGYDAAKTDLIMQLDGDDLIEPTTLEMLAWHLLSYPEYAFAKGYTVAFGADEYLWSKGFHHGKEFLCDNLVTPTAMVRRSAHRQAGGYDPAIRGGLEDWDFWIRCANAGLWGDTVPLYIEWYRRRPNHTQRWENLDETRLLEFRDQLRVRYPRLTPDTFPAPSELPPTHIPRDLPLSNELRKDNPRLLMIVPWLTVGGADKFNRDLVEKLTARGWQVTIATTLAGDHSWLPEFARHTADIFPLCHFLRVNEYPLFLRYLIESRKPDVVLISHSEMGYQLLPYLRAHSPQCDYMDYCHIEEEHWKAGGYPRMSLHSQNHLDLSAVGSQHLRNWMIQRGAQPCRVEVCYTNVDASRYAPDPQVRQRIRQELGIAPDTVVILYPARLCPQKQPRMFAETIAQLHRAGATNYLALVAGDGELRHEIEAVIRARRLQDHIRILGAVPIDHVRDLMLASDILLLPSTWEGIALSIYEAMAAGMPVVASDVGGQSELLTPDCGFLLPRSATASDYAAVLAQLIANPQLRLDLGTQARQRVIRRFRLQSMADRMIELFAKAKALHRNAPRPTLSPELALQSASAAIGRFRITPAVPSVPDRSAANDLARRLRIETELDAIENARSWRTWQWLKNSALYTLYASAIHGRQWRKQPHDPQQRLQWIKASRAYRLIRGAKLNPLYRWYANRKYGPGWQSHPGV